MSVTVGSPKVLSTNAFGDSPQRVGVADQHLDVALGRLDDAAHDRVGFRVHAGGIERVLAALDAQEAGTLLECLGAKPRHLHERLTRAERPVLVAMQHDVLRQPGPDAGDAREQRR